MEEIIPALRFNILTPLFDFFCKIVGFGKSYRRKIISKLPIKLEKEVVLDAGCGSGSLAIDVKKKFKEISLYAIDADTKILEIADKKAKREDLQIKFKKAFLQNLPFSDNSVDLVYSSLVFHHLNSEIKKEAMKEIYRVLKKGGRFLLVDFGKPTNKLFSVLSLFTILFEEGYDNYKGKIPEMLSCAGFSKVVEIGRYRFNMDFLEAIKK